MRGRRRRGDAQARGRAPDAPEPAQRAGERWRAQDLPLHAAGNEVRLRRT